uniref:Uncharacterized protein n=1 Tax=Timema monikensis TaxID=170555 RepID=A0A7R9HSM7_9NEOP|nr:unnamed protein product [Timema monikensis]
MSAMIDPSGAVDSIGRQNCSHGHRYNNIQDHGRSEEHNTGSTSRRSHGSRSSLFFDFCLQELHSYLVMFQCTSDIILRWSQGAVVVGQQVADVPDIWLCAGGHKVRWWWGSKLLVDSSDPDVTLNSRVKIFPNNTLQVSDLRAEDTGEYKCQVIRPKPWGLMEQLHAIEVLYPPSVVPHPGTGLLEVQLGGDVDMGCEAKGVPKPIITWTNRHGDEMQLLDHRPRLRFRADDRQLSGTYTCVAINGVGEPANATIQLRILCKSSRQGYPHRMSRWNQANGAAWGEIKGGGETDEGEGSGEVGYVNPRERGGIWNEEPSWERVGPPVEYPGLVVLGVGPWIPLLDPPEVTVDKTWIHAAPGLRSELVCRVMADPQARVEWVFQDRPVVTSSRVIALSINEKNTLLIRSVRASELGHYTCKASNMMGHSQQVVELSGVANSAVFKSEYHRVPSNSNYTLVWEVDSYSAIIEYNLMFRRYNPTVNTPWTKLVIPADVYAAGPLHTRSYTLTGLSPATVYEGMVLSRNRFGWSRPSAILRFGTDGSGSEDNELVQHMDTRDENLLPVQVAAMVHQYNSVAICRPILEATILLAAVATWYETT